MHLSALDLQAVLDQGLGAEAHQAARAHLAVCRRCALRLQHQAELFAAIESWDDTPPPHDLGPMVVHSLRAQQTPEGLRVATAVQAGLVVVVTALAWPLVTGVLSSIPLPTLADLEPGLSDMIAAQAEAGLRAAEASLGQLSSSAEAWLRLAPQWMALWPAIIAGAVVVAVLGNSFLLTGGAGRREIRPRRS